MTDLDEVMAAVEDYRSACEAVPLQSPGYKRAEQQWEADMATTRKAVEQAVARLVLRELAEAKAAEEQRDRLAAVVEDLVSWIERGVDRNRARIVRNARAALADVPGGGER